MAAGVSYFDFQQILLFLLQASAGLGPDAARVWDSPALAG
jgi:hypothetical protein